MGRPRKPLGINQKHFTKAEIAEREAGKIRANDDQIEAPLYLTKLQRDEFDFIADQLKELDIMSNLDVYCLASFIIARDSYIKVTKELRKTKLDVEALGKHIALSKLQERYFKQARASASDLGLSITSRCKLVVPKKVEEQKVNKFSKFMGGEP